MAESENMNKHNLIENLLVLIPTKGDVRKLKISLRSLNHSAARYNISLKILLSINSEEIIPNLEILEFENLQMDVQYLKHYQDSAEESTLRALEILENYEHKDPYIWILGDDDFILPQGLNKLIEVTKQSNYKVFFFNSLQSETSGKLLKGPFIHSYETTEVEDFTQFALKCGINFSPTGFGRLVIRASTIKDLQVWNRLISDGGPIFSYVTYFMYALTKIPMLYVNTPLIIYRQSMYHEGNHDMWTEYAKRRRTLEFAPWTSELISQIKILQELGTINTKELSNSTIIEREIGYRFPILILEQFHEQMRVAIADSKQLPSSEYIELCANFLSIIAPDLSPIVERIEFLYDDCVQKKESKKQLIHKWRQIRHIIVEIRTKNPYTGLLIDFYQGFAIYSHLDGFLATFGAPKTTYSAYRILDPRNQNKVMFARHHDEILLRINEYHAESKQTKNQNFRSSYPENIFEWAYGREHRTMAYSENVEKILAIEFSIWNKIPKIVRNLIRNVVRKKRM